jgi:curved DNA-binding protein CbpA
VAGADHAVMQALNQAWATLGDPSRRRAYDNMLGIGSSNGSAPRRPGPPPEPAPIVVDEEGEADWGPEPEPAPGTKRDLWLLVPVALLGCAAVSVGFGALLYAPVFLGLAVFFVALALFGFALVPILTLRRQARRTYRSSS